MIRRLLIGAVAAFVCSCAGSPLLYKKEGVAKSNRVSVEFTRAGSDLLFAKLKQHAKLVVVSRDGDYQVLVHHNFSAISCRVFSKTGEVVLIRTVLITANYEDALDLFIEDLVKLIT